MNDKQEVVTALDARPSTLDSLDGARRSTLDPRRHWLVFLLFAPFLASVFGAWAWFNTLLCVE